MSAGRERLSGGAEMTAELMHRQHTLSVLLIQQDLSLSLFLSLSLSLRFNGHFPGGPSLVCQYQNVSILDVIGAKDDRSGG